MKSNLISLGMLLLLSGCQSTDLRIKSTNAGDQPNPAISVSRPQANNDFPVSYWVHAQETDQRVIIANRLEIIEPVKKPDGWFDKMKSFFGFSAE
jgi:hypothetical protein